MKTLVILTGNELRHTYVRKALALMDGVKVLKSYCETKPKPPVEDANQDAHLKARDNSEQDFFGSAVELTEDLSLPVFINFGDINEEQHIQDIIDLNPDFLVAYGCSIIKGQLLEHFEGRFFNVHLGLSPYYRGTGTNFWPLVNGEPEYVGATFMHMDSGLDTGNIIHQTRARIYKGDGPHQIGNRVIRDIPFVYAEIIRHYDQLQPMEQLELNREEKVYRRKDFSPEATEQIYKNFESGMIEDYLANDNARDSAAPIVQNPLIKEQNFS